MEPPTLTLTPLLSSNHLPLPPDDFSTRNADDFFVDGLLDFSTNDTDAAFLQDDHNSQLLHDTKPSSLSPIKTTLPETELSLPVDDVAELEWLSQFVDDSFSGEYFLTFPAGNSPESKPETETVTLVAVNPHFNVHKKARSKRSRTGGRVWSLRSSAPPLTDSSASSSSSSSSSCTSKPPPAVEEGPVKRQKKRRSAAAAEPAPMARRCSHCFVQKTPQWRAGPLGAKTLCNACGVRFKSGRLLPEYRPACSPTFSSEVHSNSHRKVLEMRRKKEEEDGGGLSFPVHSS
ncbi:hypothetical protein OSB04_027450 [Centaurea solstitialis]|uniref:GATA transcription factor n=1 Tax=Centaurea solstitialis TaxID=347529 RepID=A0AA38SDM0_9ASTR|nr:hypothetical protein OSB04_027450 [Centaurea solstitialis]